MFVFECLLLICAPYRPYEVERPPLLPPLPAEYMQRGMTYKVSGDANGVVIQIGTCKGIGVWRGNVLYVEWFMEGSAKAVWIGEYRFTDGELVGWIVSTSKYRVIQQEKYVRKKP